MKKIAIVVALASFASLVQAASKDNTWSMGGKLGWSQFHDTGWYKSEFNNDGPTHKDQLGAGVFGGYQVNPHVGFEMGFDWLGRIPYKGDIVNGAFKAQGVQLSTRLNYPIVDDLDVYTRLGGMVWHTDSTNSFASDNHTTGVSPVFAGGIEWVMTHEIATRLEYQRINNIGDLNTVGVRPDNGMLSIGFSYRFGQQKAPIVIAQTPEVQTKRFDLKSDVMFNFNKVSLKPNAQQILDQLYSQLINLDPKNGSIIVLGFSDRIGSNAYNQDLSEKRAKLVADYLISKNIPNIKISSRGMGESNSVTANTCDNVRPRKALINCLAPDRRVEIEVKGIKEVIAQPAT